MDKVLNLSAFGEIMKKPNNTIGVHQGNINVQSTTQNGTSEYVSNKIATLAMCVIWTT